MKKLFLFSVLALLAFACTQKQTQKTDDKVQAVAVANKTANIDIEGMSCTGCENTIKDAVSKIAGVTEVSASHTEGLAVVKYDSTKTDFKAISDAITNVGYTVKGEKDPAAAPPSAN